MHALLETRCLRGGASARRESSVFFFPVGRVKSTDRSQDSRVKKRVFFISGVVTTQIGVHPIPPEPLKCARDDGCLVRGCEGSVRPLAVPFPRCEGGERERKAGKRNKWVPRNRNNSSTVVTRFVSPKALITWGRCMCACRC
jgi:hypothetical protein